MVSARTSRAPRSATSRASCGSNTAPRKSENRLVTIKTGNRDRTELVEHFPFRRALLEVIPISRRAGQVERFPASFDPFADLRTHLAESRPASFEPGQGPLQELDAFEILHDAAIGGRDGTVPGLNRRSAP